ncbi:hypothetical protein BJ980_001686 [Nocardioides daedukensis]|uniref:Uncharacterized protein n=1 Tax=Nocardioides daedukensis TaxID=634462 RepID=A0A7Y9S239_9ACTN|nr:hypothetical protein [Nocardioides daedukensis]NYG58763.1 hypothetical protein [Nocardioides daedukensis]
MEDLLVGGLDDWADAGWALQSARLSGENDPTALRDLTLALIAEVLRGGLMVAGDVIGSDHVPWPGGPDQWAERIRREWLDEWPDEVPTPGAIVWLRNTPAGDQVVRDVLDRERGE